MSEAENGSGAAGQTGELDIRRLQIEADLKRLEIRAGIWKVALGTMVVGIAAAAFPFLQTYATQYFSWRSAVLAKDAETRLQVFEQRTQTTTLNRDFLASVAKEGRSKNLEDRIILAEYYFYLANEGAERTRWKTFLDHLLTLRGEERAAALKAVEVATNPKSTAADIEIARERARQLKVSSEAGGKAPPAYSAPDDLDILSLLENLTSDDTTTRRGARTELASKGLALVRPAVLALAEEDISYRRRLGVVVALTEMMRENKNQRRLIADLLRPDDLGLLLEAATDADRTIRIYAGEFLFDLGDPRTFDMALKAWPGISDDNGRYNLVLVMKGAAPDIEPERADTARERLESLLGQVGPKTDTLIREAIALLPSE